MCPCKCDEPLGGTSTSTLQVEESDSTALRRDRGGHPRAVEGVLGGGIGAAGTEVSACKQLCGKTST